MDQKSSRHEQVNYIDSSVESKVLLTTEESSTWLLDSGASYHMTPHRSQFRKYSDRHSDSVRVGNSQHCAIIGIGTVELNLPGGSTLVLDNVQHVPELSRPLISSGGWTLHKGNLLLARGPKVHSLYPLYVTLKEGDLFLVDIPVSSLWQGPLGHLSKAGITHLSRTDYIPKLSFSDH